MIENLESEYNCANAGDDLHKLKQELAALQAQTSTDGNREEEMNRIENQIQFILNKCDIH